MDRAARPLVPVHSDVVAMATGAGRKNRNSRCFALVAHAVAMRCDNELVEKEHARME